MKNTQWRSLLKLGNDCFQTQQWSQAESLYSEAYELLVNDCLNTPLSSEILAAWISACHYLALLYETQNNIKLALKFLLLPHEYLNSIADSNKTSEIMKSVAIEGMSLTHPPLVSFMKKNALYGNSVPESKLLNKAHEGTVVFAH